MVERLDRPAAGDRYEVAYEGDDGCGYVVVRADGLILRAGADMSEPVVPDGHGTLVLRRVWDLDSKDGGLGASGQLTLEDGSKMTVDGGTEGKVFFTLACAIRGD
ncbi:hypothetical protein BH10ACT1_BH10ACT1_17940 [soil metagenome]